MSPRNTRMNANKNEVPLDLAKLYPKAFGYVAVSLWIRPDAGQRALRTLEAFPGKLFFDSRQLA
jgi:hypothetical protein